MQACLSKVIPLLYLGLEVRRRTRFLRKSIIKNLISIFDNVNFYTRVGIIGTNFFIAIIDKILEIIAILSVIGDNFGKQKSSYLRKF